MCDNDIGKQFGKFCPKCKCEICIFRSIDDNGEESCYWGYIDEARKLLKQPHTKE